jgi:hypothetical protein
MIMIMQWHLSAVVNFNICICIFRCLVHIYLVRELCYCMGRRRQSIADEPCTSAIQPPIVVAHPRRRRTHRYNSICWVCCRIIKDLNMNRHMEMMHPGVEHQGQFVPCLVAAKHLRRNPCYSDQDVACQTDFSLPSPLYQGVVDAVQLAHDEDDDNNHLCRDMVANIYERARLDCGQCLMMEYGFSLAGTDALHTNGCHAHPSTLLTKYLPDVLAAYGQFDLARITTAVHNVFMALCMDYHNANPSTTTTDDGTVTLLTYSTSTTATDDCKDLSTIITAGCSYN